MRKGLVLQSNILLHRIEDLSLIALYRPKWRVTTPRERLPASRTNYLSKITETPYFKVSPVYSLFFLSLFYRPCLDSKSQTVLSTTKTARPWRASLLSMKAFFKHIRVPR